MQCMMFPYIYSESFVSLMLFTVIKWMSMCVILVGFALHFCGDFFFKVWIVRFKTFLQVRIMPSKAVSSLGRRHPASHLAWINSTLRQVRMLEKQGEEHQDHLAAISTPWDMMKMISSLETGIHFGTETLPSLEVMIRSRKLTDNSKV